MWAAMREARAARFGFSRKCSTFQLKNENPMPNLLRPLMAREDSSNAGRRYGKQCARCRLTQTGQPHQFLSQLLAQAACRLRGAGHLGANDAAAFGEERIELERVAEVLGVGGGGEATAAIDGCEERALRRYHLAQGRVIDLG